MPWGGSPLLPLSGSAFRLSCQDYGSVLPPGLPHPTPPPAGVFLDESVSSTKSNKVVQQLKKKQPTLRLSTAG